MRYRAFVALNQISFRAESGQVLGLLGPNGAGKTTVMRILTTYLYPTAADVVRVDDVDALTNPIEARKCIGYLPETVPLYLDMTTEEYLHFVAGARGLNGALLQERLNWVKENCGLKLVWKHLLAELSKGYKQRVGLAQALIHDPKVLILDEPTSGLDPIQIVEIRSLIKMLVKNKTIIFSTHILQEIEALADKVVVINEGRIVANGTLSELAQQTQVSEQNKKAYDIEEIFIKLLSSNGSKQ